MKVIFLDIDGVINSYDNLYALNALYKLKLAVSRDEFGQLFDERCTRWLRYIIERTGAKIVISSTWRSAGLVKMQTMWQIRELAGEVIGCTPTYVDDYIINLHACTNNEADRGYEIQQWIEENKPERYCIIDDDRDMLGAQLPFFVRTDNRTGLDYKTAHQAIAILNGQNTI
jgi:hypothetical protein